MTKLVEDRLRDLWALLATAAAAKAMSQIKYHDNPDSAERYAKVTERWLQRAGSRATDRHYRSPSCGQ